MSTAARWTDLAEWRGPTVNHGGAMREWRGLVLHIAEGSYEGTISWQKKPGTNVSSHFVVGADGRIAQVVETDVTAWTQIAGNGRWLSAENAGFTPHALTSAQLDANARLLARMHRDYGVPLRVATDPTGRGLGHHSMGGTSWGHLDCPGPAIIAQKQEIVRRAVLIVGGDIVAAYPTPGEIEHAVWHTPGSTGNVDSEGKSISAGTALGSSYYRLIEVETRVAEMDGKLDRLIAALPPPPGP